MAPRSDTIWKKLRGFRSQHCLYEVGNEVARQVSGVKRSACFETCLATQLQDQMGSIGSEMYVPGDEKNEENESVALDEPHPWKAQYIVCYESSWS